MSVGYGIPGRVSSYFQRFNCVYLIRYHWPFNDIYGSTGRWNIDCGVREMTGQAEATSSLQKESIESMPQSELFRTGTSLVIVDSLVAALTKRQMA